jgi:hypothetical protein
MLYIKTHRWIVAKGAAILSSFALLSPLAPAEKACVGESTPAQQQIAQQLDSFQRTAALTRGELDQYAAAARSGNLHQQTHAGSLDGAKENVNLLANK